MARKFFVGGNWKCNGTLEKVKKIVVMLNEGAVPSSDVVDRVCDAFEVAGRNVMSTYNTVTTELVAHKYREDAGKATNESLDAAGHAIGSAWTVFKIRKAMNPKSVMRSSNLAKYGDMTFKDKKKDKKKDMKKDKNDKKECKSKK